MEKLSDTARLSKNEYQRQYRTNMTPEARQAQKDYIREWRKKNSDKIRKYNNDYWERKGLNIPIADRVKDLRQAGMTQRAIAEKLNISLGTVNKYLVNKNEQS